MALVRISANPATRAPSKEDPPSQRLYIYPKSKRFPIIPTKDLRTPAAFFWRLQRHLRKPAAFKAFLFLAAKSASFLSLKCRAASRSASRTTTKKARAPLPPTAAVAGNPKKSRPLARFFRGNRHREGGEAEGG